MRNLAFLAAASLAVGCVHPRSELPATETFSPVLRQLRSEAANLAPLVQSPWVRDFLAATAELPGPCLLPGTRPVAAATARHRPPGTAVKAWRLPARPPALLCRRCRA